MQAQDLFFEDISIGESASFERTITKKDVANFAELSGDLNPLHTDERYASTTRFKRPIVHGMFLGALCSRFVGMYLPGKRCVYIGQTLSFKNPVFVGDTVKVSGIVVSKSASTHLLTIRMTISIAEKVAAEGESTVQMLK